MPASSKLFEPVTLGNAKLQNRIAMAPLTRFRADDDHVPLPFVKGITTIPTRTPPKPMH